MTVPAVLLPGQQGIITLQVQNARGADDCVAACLSDTSSLQLGNFQWISPCVQGEVAIQRQEAFGFEAEAEVLCEVSHATIAFIASANASIDLLGIDPLAVHAVTIGPRQESTTAYGFLGTMDTAEVLLLPSTANSFQWNTSLTFADGVVVQCMHAASIGQLPLSVSYEPAGLALRFPANATHITNDFFDHYQPLSLEQRCTAVLDDTEMFRVQQSWSCPPHCLGPGQGVFPIHSCGPVTLQCLDRETASDCYFGEGPACAACPDGAACPGKSVNQPSPPLAPC